MFGRVLLYIVLSLVVSAFALPEAAVAGWPLSGPAEVILGYGQTYPCGSGVVVHRGVDLSAEPGAAILAAFDGRVSFAGRVPAASGGTRGAVTIEFGDGLRITCLPLDDIGVSSGQQVTAGSVIGTLSGTGDESSPVSHLHVSIRRADAYLDPMAYLVAPAAVSALPETAPVEAPEVAEPPSVESPILEPAPSAGAVSAPMPVPAPVKPGLAGTGETLSRVPVTTRSPAESAIAAQAALRWADTRAAKQGEQLLAPTSHLSQAQLLPGGYFEASCADDLAGQVKQETLKANGASQSNAHVSSRTRGSSRLTRGSVSGLGALVVAIGSCLGLWPLWRCRPNKSQGFAVSVGDDLAVAVGR